jgi:hypothetical protein
MNCVWSKAEYVGRPGRATRSQAQSGPVRSASGAHQVPDFGRSAGTKAVVEAMVNRHSRDRLGREAMAYCSRCAAPLTRLGYRVMLELPHSLCSGDQLDPLPTLHLLGFIPPPRRVVSSRAHRLDWCARQSSDCHCGLVGPRPNCSAQYRTLWRLPTTHRVVAVVDTCSADVGPSPSFEQEALRVIMQHRSTVPPKRSFKNHLIVQQLIGLMPDCIG